MTKADADVAVVGSGPGGATLAYALAQAGRSVVVVERGRDLSGPETLRGRPPEVVAAFSTSDAAAQNKLLGLGGRNSEVWRQGYGGAAFVPFLGDGTGGSSSLFGMALERRYPHDFEGWPIGYQDLAPWYEEAERLYGVQGSADPLRQPEPGCTEPREPLSEANATIFAALRRGGLHPYRQHLACTRVADCGLCQSYLCDAGECKRDARVVCLDPAVRQERVQLLAETRATRLETAGGRVTALVLERRGEKLRVEAKVTVVAAGAMATPRLLTRSGVGQESGLLGRRLMRHAIDLFVLAAAPRHRKAGEAKELALNDFYAQGADRLGTVQSFGMAPTLEYLRNKPGRNLWKALGPLAVPIARAFAGAPIVASILDDQATSENRVDEDGSGPRLWYQLPARDQVRRKRVRRLMLRAFARYLPVRVIGTSELPALGHVCGTAVFGRNAATSVLDENNRVHGLANLYVTDASFFPTSGGVNPALTIMANALRVADHLNRNVL